MGETLLDGRVTLWRGDSRDVLQGFEDATFDSVVTDPPYALVSIQKRFGKPGSAPAQHGRDGLYSRASAGFMGQQWDTGETAFAAEFWAEVLRVLKPGGHVVAFSGTRTYHRMVCAIEDAGFEIRDQIGWAFGSGFPKSHNQKGEWQGWGTALKPAWEPVCLARKPLVGTVAENLLQHRVGALNIDGCRVATKDEIVATRNVALGSSSGGVFGAADKPGVYVQKAAGRWPANLLHDGSDEVLACFPDTNPARAGKPRSGRHGDGYGMTHTGAEYNDDGGSASRFFYTAKADAEDRAGSRHPTVKPVDLMQYLCRLVTPPGGLILDPFAGTGTTGEAAWREGFRAVLIEREPQYQQDIIRRMEWAQLGPEGRALAMAKHKGGAHDPLPLFGEAAE